MLFNSPFARRRLSRVLRSNCAFSRHPRETVITKKHCPRLVGLYTRPRAAQCVCECVYVSVEYLFGIERSRICVGSVARPRHWKTTGSPELGNAEAVTYFANLHNFPISRRARSTPPPRFLLAHRFTSLSVCNPCALQSRPATLRPARIYSTIVFTRLLPFTC